MAWDATPVADNVLYTGTVNSRTGLYSVDSDQPLLEVGEPVAVVGSEDDSTVYVGDAAEDQVVTMEGVPVAGSTGLGVRALDFHGGSLYILGGTEGNSRLYRLDPAGGSPELMGEVGAMLSGVVVAADGTAFAAGWSSAGEGVVYRFSAGAASVLNQGTEPGEPTGIELTPDESTLLVSALSPSDDGSLHSNVLLVDIATGTGSLLNEPTIGANVGSGGLHQSQSSPGSYAWCGYTGSGKGGIYGVDL